jgi:hypothetical protein
LVLDVISNNQQGKKKVLYHLIHLKYDRLHHNMCAWGDIGVNIYVSK